MIAVIGATGLLGGPVVERLLDDGFQVRVLSRTPITAKEQLGNRPEYAHADVTDFDSLVHGFEGCTAVHINLNTDHDASPDDVLHEGLVNVANAAAECGIQKISLISGDWEPDPQHAWSRRAALSKGILALEAGSVPTVVWCCTWFFESLDYFVMPDRGLMVGEQPLTWHFVAAHDYAKMVSALMEEEEWQGHRRYTVHGPRGMKMLGALQYYCEQLRPGLPVEQVSIAEAKELAAQDEEMAWLDSFADFMAKFEQYGETGNPQAAAALLRGPLMTIEDWCKHLLA
ncbi:MAG: NAD(P)H-binding protein [bacterium]|nr:NAD(P)H-binding protein [bacterium]